MRLFVKLSPRVTKEYPLTRAHAIGELSPRIHIQVHGLIKNKVTKPKVIFGIFLP